MSSFDQLIDKANDELIRAKLHELDEAKRLGVTADRIGIAGGADTLRSIMNSTGELSLMDRGMLVVLLGIMHVDS